MVFCVLIGDPISWLFWGIQTSNSEWLGGKVLQTEGGGTGEKETGGEEEERDKQKAKR